MSPSRSDRRDALVSASKNETHDAYHHGDLKNALLEAAEMLLEEKGTSTFSLRECARRVGVSPTAVSHHFGNALGLMVAVATVSFLDLSARLTAATKLAARRGTDPLEAVCDAYLVFAENKAARYRIMFNDDVHDKSSAEYVSASRGSFRVLLNTVANGRGRCTGAHPAKQDWADAFFVWTSLHGFATLERTSKLKFLQAPLDIRSMSDLRKAFLSMLVHRVRARSSRSRL
jgi:AcrR family transcriptional regulator